MRLFLLQDRQDPTPIKEKTSSHTQLPRGSQGKTTTHRQRTFRKTCHRRCQTTTKLLRTFLQAPIHSTQEPRPQYTNPFQAATKQLPLKKHHHRKKATINTLFHQRSVPFTRLFQQSNRGKSQGVNTKMCPTRSSQHNRERPTQPKRSSQTNNQQAKVPMSTTFHPLLRAMYQLRTRSMSSTKVENNVPSQQLPTSPMNQEHRTHVTLRMFTRRQLIKGVRMVNSLLGTRHKMFRRILNFRRSMIISPLSNHPTTNLTSRHHRMFKHRIRLSNVRTRQSLLHMIFTRGVRRLTRVLIITTTHQSLPLSTHFSIASSSTTRLMNRHPSSQACSLNKVSIHQRLHALNTRFLRQPNSSHPLLFIRFRAKLLLRIRRRLQRRPSICISTPSRLLFTSRNIRHSLLNQFNLSSQPQRICRSQVLHRHVPHRIQNRNSQAFKARRSSRNISTHQVTRRISISFILRISTQHSRATIMTSISKATTTSISRHNRQGTLSVLFIRFIISFSCGCGGLPISVHQGIRGQAGQQI